MQGPEGRTVNTSSNSSGGNMALKIVVIAFLAVIGAGVALVVFASLWGLFISVK